MGNYLSGKNDGYEVEPFIEAENGNRSKDGDTKVKSFYDKNKTLISSNENSDSSDKAEWSSNSA